MALPPFVVGVFQTGVKAPGLGLVTLSRTGAAGMHPASNSELEVFPLPFILTSVTLIVYFT